MNKYKIIIILLFVSIVTGCTGKKNNINHNIIEIIKDNDIVINKNDINENATYYNYIDDDVTIQIFVIKASDGTIRTLFNTCTACSPSPMSYFIQDGDYFECQNCKNRFHKDEIGLKKGFGCSPIAILDEDKEYNEETIVIKTDFIETYKSRFIGVNNYENI